MPTSLATPASGGKTGPSAKRERFGVTLVPVIADPTGAPRKYASDLTPSESPCRPKCRADERLELWRSIFRWVAQDASGTLHPQLATTIDRAVTVRAHSLALSTRTTYGSAILIYAVWADLQGLSDNARFPTSTSITSCWVADMAGSYSETTVSSYVAALRAWHEVQGVPWRIDEAVVRRTIKGCRNYQPEGSTRPKREPYTIDLLLRILAYLDLEKPLDAAVWAACCVAFFGQARLGELLVKSGVYSIFTHPHRAALTQVVTKSGDHVSQLLLPRTKVVSVGGEFIHWGRQLSDSCDPDTAVANHLRVNEGALDRDHFFAYRVQPPKKRKRDALPPPAEFHALTRMVFTATLVKAAKKAKLTLPPAHGFRIGGTTEYLLRGLPFEVVKHLGRWAGNSFSLYLRRHAEILAPYLGEREPDALARMTRAIELPPVR
jgi:hypothetical protein